MVINRGIEIFGMQALMYGKPKLNLFGDESVQKPCLIILKRFVNRSILGVKKLVLDLPKIEINQV